MKPGRDMHAQLQDTAAHRVELQGDLDFNTVPDLWPLLEKRITGGGDLDVDLAGVERADSAGLALLVACLRAADGSGRNLRFFNIPGQMLSIARVSGVDEMLPLQSD